MYRKGYIVFYSCNKGEIVTRSRKFEIEKGPYFYVGSCGKSCSDRISRHMRKCKNKFWHVDYLTDLCTPLGSLILPMEEREIVKMFKGLRVIHRFGNSDDRESEGHLFLGGMKDIIILVLEKVSVK